MKCYATQILFTEKENPRSVNIEYRLGKVGIRSVQKEWQGTSRKVIAANAKLIVVDLTENVKAQILADIGTEKLDSLFSG